MSVGITMTVNSISGVIGTSFDDNIEGNSLDNQLVGGAGADSLVGKGGAGTLGLLLDVESFSLGDSPP